MHVEPDEPEDAIGFGETPCDDTLQRGHVTAGPRLMMLRRQVAHLQQHVDGCDHIRTRKDIGSCTSSLRLIPPPSKPGTMAPQHTTRRGHDHDSAPCLLPTRDFGARVALRSLSFPLAKPRRAGTS